VLTIPRSVRIFIGSTPIDMRKSIDGLMAIVQEELEQDAYSGFLFVFVSRRADRVKILTWDKGGFVLVYKRLLCGAPHKSRYAEPVLMRGVSEDHVGNRALKQGHAAHNHERGPLAHGGLPRPSSRDAIRASGALNLPRRSAGGTAASIASSFSQGSMRR